MLGVAATLPSSMLICWTGWSALTPPPMLIASIGLGGILWGRFAVATAAPDRA